MAARKRPDKRKSLPPLKVVVMSATLDVETFEKFFDEGADKIKIPGRQFPVQILYTKDPQEVGTPYQKMAFAVLIRDLKESRILTMLCPFLSTRTTLMLPFVRPCKFTRILMMKMTYWFFFLAKRKLRIFLCFSKAILTKQPIYQNHSPVTWCSPFGVLEPTCQERQILSTGYLFVFSMLLFLRKSKCLLSSPRQKDASGRLFYLPISQRPPLR